MRLRTLIAIAVTMCALPVIAGELPTAPAPRAANQSTVVKLRNVAAADAAQAIGLHLKARKLNAIVVAESVSNSVLLSAEPALEKQLLDLLAALDKTPPTVVFSVLVLNVPKDFVAECGLNVGAAPNANSWTLSPRELQMFTALIRAAKGRGECDILARPALCVLDNQTGFVQVGQRVAAGVGDGANGAVGFTCQLTPRVNPDGRLLLRTKAEMTEQGASVAITTTVPGFPFPLTQLVPSFNTQSVQTTNELKIGETLVTRVGETLVIITPTVIAK